MSDNLNQVRPISYELTDSNEIMVGGLKLEALRQQYSTPLYVMCEDTIRERAKAYEEAFKKHYPNHLTIYASKAFNCKAMCQIIAEEGLGIDVVSGGELYTALRANFPVERIIFHGNNKSKAELKMAMENNIGAIMLDNFYELSLIEELLAEGASSKVNLMLRVTPGIECHTHEYIKTGSIDSKFGFKLEELNTLIEKLLELKKKYAGIHVRGLHAHIGSQIFETVAHKDTVRVLIELYRDIKEKYGIEFEDLNVGGGLGIKYLESDDPPNIEAWVKVVADAIKANCSELSVKEPRIMVEPGRSMVGPAGMTIYTVGNIKDIPGVRKYVCVDGGMADNSRPIMYQAEYLAEIDTKVNDSKLEKVTVAGKYCESGDILIRDIELPEAQPGDLLTVLSTGAYNYSMASNYNRATKPAVVLVKDGKSRVIVKAETLDDLVRLDN